MATLQLKAEPSSFKWSVLKMDESKRISSQEQYRIRIGEPAWWVYLASRWAPPHWLQIPITLTWLNDGTGSTFWYFWQLCPFPHARFYPSDLVLAPKPTQKTQQNIDVFGHNARIFKKIKKCTSFCKLQLCILHNYNGQWPQSLTPVTTMYLAEFEVFNINYTLGIQWR